MSMAEYKKRKGGMDMRQGRITVKTLRGLGLFLPVLLFSVSALASLVSVTTRRPTPPARLQNRESLDLQKVRA